jgi:hypothetical protein
VKQVSETRANLLFANAWPQLTANTLYGRIGDPNRLAQQAYLKGALASP